MNDTKAPIFRNAVGGYNKSDVNTYILSLSHRLEDLEKSFADAAARNKELEEKAASLQEVSQKLSELTATLPALTAELEECKAELEKEQSENSALRERADTATAEYDKLCRSAGQIFALAGNTADDILKRADDEAHKIVDDAKAARNTVFKSISETTDDFTSDISDYIKSAISNCIEKINENISAYTEETEKSPKVTFIENN